MNAHERARACTSVRPPPRTRTLRLSNCRVMKNATSQQPSELPVVHSPTGRQSHPFTIRLISPNPLTVMMTRIVSCVGIKAMSCDSANSGNVFLILGQALPTPVTAVTFLQESAENSTLSLRRIKGRHFLPFPILEALASAPTSLQTL